MTAEVFAAALGIEPPWSVAQVDFDQARKVLTIQIDFKPGSRFVVVHQTPPHGNAGGLKKN